MVNAAVEPTRLLRDTANSTQRLLTLESVQHKNKENTTSPSRDGAQIGLPGIFSSTKSLSRYLNKYFFSRKPNLSWGQVSQSVCFPIVRFPYFVFFLSFLSLGHFPVTDVVSVHVKLMGAALDPLTEVTRTIRQAVCCLSVCQRPPWPPPWILFSASLPPSSWCWKQITSNTTSRPWEENQRGNKSPCQSIRAKYSSIFIV